MKTLIALLMFSLTTLAAGAAATKVLIVTGGHGYNEGAFRGLFQSISEIKPTFAKHNPGTASVFDRVDLLQFDVAVLYDMPRTISRSQKSNFLKLFEKGTGLLVLHHALVSYQDWPEYERIIGGRYPEEKGKEGRVTESVGYEHDVDFLIENVAPEHPVTRGLASFQLHDEIYWGFRVSKDSFPLLTTSHPKSGKPIAWHRQEGKSRIVYIQPGHGPEAFANEHYRKLIAQAISWVRPANTETSKTIDLFDGTTLEGWIQRGGKARFFVEDGQIVGESVPQTPNSFLCTTREFSDFRLELEFKVDPALNSGVQIRSHALETPLEFEWNDRKIKIPAKRVHGLQVEIDPGSRSWSGGIFEEGARGWLNNLKTNEPARAAFRSEEWNKLRIEAKGSSIKTWINDVPAADLVDDRVSSGFIALQVHGVKNRDTPMQVRFRGLRLTEW